MKTKTYSDFRRNMASAIDQLAEDHEPVIITRNGGKAAAVMLSLEDFASYEETRYLLKSPKNAQRLLQAVEELDAGQGVEKALIE